MCKNPCLTEEKPFSRNDEGVTLNILRVLFAKSWLGKISVKMDIQKNLPVVCAPGYMEDPTDFCPAFYERKVKGLY